MEIKTRLKNFKASAQMKEYIEEKVGGVAKYLSNIKDVYVDIASDAHHKKGAVLNVEITLRMIDNGEKLMAQDTASDMHEALDRAVGKLKHVIKRYKGTRNKIDKDAVRQLREGE